MRKKREERKKDSKDVFYKVSEWQIYFNSCCHLVAWSHWIVMDSFPLHVLFCSWLYSFGASFNLTFPLSRLVVDMLWLLGFGVCFLFFFLSLWPHCCYFEDLYIYIFFWKIYSRLLEEFMLTWHWQIRDCTTISCDQVANDFE